MYSHKRQEVKQELHPREVSNKIEAMTEYKVAGLSRQLLWGGKDTYNVQNQDNIGKIEQAALRVKYERRDCRFKSMQRRYVI